MVFAVSLSLHRLRWLLPLTLLLGLGGCVTAGGYGYYDGYSSESLYASPGTYPYYCSGLVYGCSTGYYQFYPTVVFPLRPYRYHRGDHRDYHHDNYRRGDYHQGGSYGGHRWSGQQDGSHSSRPQWHPASPSPDQHRP